MGRQNEALLRVGGVTGMARSLQTLARSGGADTELDKEMKAASKAAAEKVIPYAKAKVPVVSGALRDTIRADATRRYGRINAGTPSKVTYARYVHRGRYVGKGKTTKATKFISSVIPTAYPEIGDEYIRAMNTIAAKFEKRHGVSRSIYRK